MHGIRIRDLTERNVLAVNLHRVLELLGERAIRSRWKASEVWAPGEEGSELEKLADGRTLLDGMDLVRLASIIVQVIDGEFQAFDLGNSSPWVIICAVDSTYYAIFSPEKSVLDKVRASFREVSDCEDDF